MVKATKTNLKNRGKSWLAEQLGISPSRVTELIRQKRIPDRIQYTDHERDEARRMLEQARAANPASGGIASLDQQIAAITRNPLHVARIKLLVAQAARVQQRTAIESGLWIDREEVERERVKRVHIVRMRMEEIILRGEEIANRPEEQVKQWLEAEFRRMCDEFASSPTGV
jgi:hypothetical protein